MRRAHVSRTAWLEPAAGRSCEMTMAAARRSLAAAGLLFARQNHKGRAWRGTHVDHVYVAHPSVEPEGLDPVAGLDNVPLPGRL